MHNLGCQDYPFKPRLAQKGITRFQSRELGIGYSFLFTYPLLHTYPQRKLILFFSSSSAKVVFQTACSEL